MKKETIQNHSYLSFELGREIFAAHVSYVINILEMTKITQVPTSPPYMLGIINLRGTVLPLIDLRMKFGMVPTPITNNTCILVLCVNIDRETIMLGALVDSVREVLEIEPEKIQPAPSLGGKFNTIGFKGVYKDINDDFIQIVDMDSILAMKELSVLKSESTKVNKLEEITN
ncbi:MAG: chemotaxis protein CheW [Bacteroidales bacterium]|nr:chemotaxis protein CheW [Bacteroidales bacterium]